MYVIGLRQPYSPIVFAQFFVPRLFVGEIFYFLKLLGVVVNRDAPDIRPDNPAFFIRYPAGYQIALRISGRISGYVYQIQ
jgi:hypothetical protein